MQKSKMLKSNLDDEMDYLSKEELDFFLDEPEMSEMLSTLVTGAISLTQLVIENKIRNSEKMNDQDIYDIYNRSFKAIAIPIEKQEEL